MPRQTISLKVKNKNTFLSQSIGLLGNKAKDPIYFKTRLGIHTFFMKQSIVVVVIDENFIVRRKEVLKPWCIMFWGWQIANVVEFPLENKLHKKIKKGAHITLPD